MRLGRVVGRIWATAKSEDLEGRKLLVIQPITVEGRDAGRAADRGGCRRRGGGGNDLLEQRGRSRLRVPSR